MPEAAAEKAYERKFSTARRLLNVLISPSAGMEDIALAPNYEGAALVIIFEMVLAAVALALAFGKVQIIGDLSGQVWSIVSGVVAIALLLSFGIMIARWLVKSLLVQLGSDSGSRWSFKTAAAVTGYAYLADVVVAVVIFLAGELLLSRLLYHFHLRDRPY